MDLKVFGCLAAVQVPTTKHKKLEAERDIGTYIGHSVNSPDLLVLMPNGKVIKSQHVFLHEHIRGADRESIFAPPNKDCLIQSTPTPENWVGDVPEYIHQYKMPENEITEKHDKNGSQQLENGGEFIRKWIEGPDVPYVTNYEPKHQEQCSLAAITNSINQDTPISIKSALSNKQWRKSMQK